MKVDFLGFKGNRQNHQDWAFNIMAETNFEQSFLQALFDSDDYHPTKKNRQMQPIAALLAKKEGGVTVMVSAENFCESPIVKTEQRINELETLLLNMASCKNNDEHNQDKPEAP